MKAPFYCYDCGKPFPWTEDTIEATRMAIDEEESLKPDEREKLKLSLPDLIAETPRTTLAATRVKKAFLHIGGVTQDALKDFIVTLGCEAAKSFLGF